MPARNEQHFEALVQIMERLRGEGGCPWDREQTRESLKPFLIEEAYEVVEAIDERDSGKLKEELGDLLFQVLFHAQVAAEREEFTIGDILEATADKMVRRHPHVFADASASTSREVLEQWEALKRKERNAVTAASALDGVPKELPALLRAQRLQEKASRAGFDWPDRSGVLQKIEEEVRELKAASDGGSSDEIEREFGDLLFSLVNLARFLNLNAEDALRGSSARFIARFRHIEATIEQGGRRLRDASLEEMEGLWQEAKSLSPPPGA
jgi:tetrapyrrole methylase family protein/MazG family protein